MSLQKVIGTATLALLLSAGVAAAQTTYPTDTSGGSSNGTNVNGTTDTGTNMNGANGTTNTSPGVPNTGTSATSTGAGGSASPGVPNTGAGGNSAETMLLLASSAVIAVMGGSYLLRLRREKQM